MEKGLHPQRKFGSVDLLVCLYICKDTMTMTSQFKLPLIGNIFYLTFPKPSYVYDGDYVWFLQLKEMGPHDLDWALWLHLFIFLKGVFSLLQKEMKLNK